MTFDEWFQKEFVPSFYYSNDDPYKYESAARRAWEAAQQDPNEGLPGMDDYTYEQFSKDCDRW